MGTCTSATTNALWAAVLNSQPTPIVLLDLNSCIVLVNQSAQRLLQQDSPLVGQSVTQLPIEWQNVSHDTLHRLNIQSATFKQPDDPDSHDTAAIKLHINIGNHGMSSTTSAHLLVTNLNVADKAYRLLSFENIKDSPTVRSTPGSDDLSQPSSLRSTRPALKHKPAPHPTTLLSTKTVREAKFSQLCNAIYHNDGRAGFLLSADNSFCYPNYQGIGETLPVEIDNVDIFFDSWDVWTPDFTRPEILSEYPSIWLNREKKKFDRRRFGLKEGGKDLVIEASGRPLWDVVTGEYLGGLVWLQTLGEYADVVAADLQANLTDFQSICDRLPHILWTVDADGQADYFSQCWYDFTGLTEKQSIGLGFKDAIDATDMNNIWAKFALAKSNKTEVHAEAKYRRYDGQWIWMYVRAKPLISSNGNILKWYGTSTDIHNLVLERMEAERKKSLMMEMLAHCDIGLFEAAVDGELNVLEGRLDWLVDASYARYLTNFDDNQDAGISVLKQHLLQVTTGNQESAIFEAQIHSRWYKFRLVRNGFHDLNTNLPNTLGCSVDITEQRERIGLELENARLVNEASLEMEKSRLKTAFLAHMSHEIRTPIAGIIGLADMLIESRPEARQQEWIEDIRLSANNLLTIVNDILDLSKIEAGQLQIERTEYDILQLVTQVRKLFNHTARAKFVDLRFEYDASGPINLVGDPGKVKQILTNLVSNAIKFTSEGHVAISVFSECAKISIVVEDTGQGIDEQTMALLFHPFVQGDASTARRHGGTGLGLTISRNFANKMGGALTLESMPSKGTRATLVLPKDMGFAPATNPSQLTGDADVPACPPLAPTSSAKAASTSEHMVLVVEDNVINQKVILNLVRKLGYQTAAVCNGKEALAWLRDANTRNFKPSLVLMDCQMPVLDGYQATRILRTDQKYRGVHDVPVIALTASAIQGDKEKCQAAGMDDYLTKPATKVLLEAMLEKWITAEPP